MGFFLLRSSKTKLIRDRLLPSLTPYENIYTVPNILTFSRLLAAPVVGYLVLHDYHTWAVCLFAYAGITDLVDGYIARRWNLQTIVGTVIDPMADKTLMTILTVCLAVKGALPVWLAAIILGRDIGLGIAAIYYRWVSLPPPKTFSRYWDFSLPSAEVHPTTISKVNTFLQLALIGATTAQPLIAVDISRRDDDHLERRELPVHQGCGQDPVEAGAGAEGGSEEFETLMFVFDGNVARYAV
ncbi:MAG: hypothetical protein M1835_006923 [Candelina submexicana]|nr:MAG: hypothetical protein M1835_006923 [Candelina submexicana]